MRLLFLLAYRNVKNHWKQSLAALISITTGFIAFALFDGYLLDLYRGLTELNENIEMRGDLIISEPEGHRFEKRSRSPTPFLFFSMPFRVPGKKIRRR